MAEEFEGGVIGGNWAWNSSRNLFGSSPCSLATNDVIGSFGWPNNDVMLTERSSDDSAGSVSDGGAVQKPPPNGGFEMIGTDWSQDLLNDSGKSEQNYSNFIINSNLNNNNNNNNNYSDHFPNISSSIENLSTGFPLNSASYNYTSSLLQTLFDTDSPQQQSLLDYSNFQANSNGFIPNLSNNHLPNAPLWNPNVIPSSNFAQSHNLLPSSTLNNKRPNQPSFGAKNQNDQQSKQTKKGNNEAAAFKRPRIETPSPLPTFKVRKEKLGDRITALQQLVSPFGKTDTASVLHEAIEYIRFLHDQVNALSTPYLKYGSPPMQRQQCGDKAKDGEVLIKDLNSRGLCLVPISSTFPVAAETPADFWTPTFGGNLK